MQLGPQLVSQPAPRPRPRGLIERIGQLGERELFVQGWAVVNWRDAAPIRAGHAGRPIDGRAWTTRFHRPDVPSGTGFAAIVQLETGLAAPALQALRIGEVQLDRYEQARLLKPDQSLRALRETLRDRPLASIPRPLASVAGRFDGSDTIAGSRWPVRIGIDDCARIADAVLVSGWLFDPEALVRSVAIGSSSSHVTISDDWLRSPRPDVDAAMAADPVLAGYTGTSRPHGFMALVPNIATTGHLHLSLNLETHLPLHAPLSARDGHPLSLLRRFLASIPPDAPTSLDAAERIVAPILANLRQPLSSQRLPEISGPFATVVGIDGCGQDCASLLALLAAEPHARSKPIVIAAARPEIDACRAELCRTAEGYGLDLHFAALDRAEDALDAMLQVAARITADQICLIDFSALPEEPGWLSRLSARSESGQVVSPSIMAGADRLDDFSSCFVSATGTLASALTPHQAFLTRSARAGWLRQRFEALGNPVHSVEDVRFRAVPEPIEPSLSLMLRADRAAMRMRGN